MKKHLWLAAGLIAVVAIVAALSFPARDAARAPAPGAALTEAAEGLDEVVIDAVFDPAHATLTVEQTLRLVNRQSAPLTTLVLRVYANAFASEALSPAAIDELYDATYPNGFSAGGARFGAVMVAMGDAEAAHATFAYDDAAQTAMRLTLPQAWAAGEALTVSLRYVLTIPHAAYRFGESDGLWALGNAFVLPAAMEDGAYRTDAYCPIGNPFVSECRNDTVTLTVPRGYRAAASAYAAPETTEDGNWRYRFEALAVRDFALCLSKEYQLAQAEQDGVLVSVFARRNPSEALRWALQALRCYAGLYGAYPYPSYALAEIDLPFDGMAYPGLSMLASDRWSAGGEALERLTACEAARQWWGATVGSDGFYQPWQDLALAEFSLLDYWGTYHGAAARASLRESRVESSMRVTVPRGVTPGSPVDTFGDWSEYSVVVRSRGASAMCALNEALDGGLDGFLSAYYDTYAFAVASRADFEGLLREYGGEDWSPLLSDYLDTYVEN